MKNLLPLTIMLALSYSVNQASALSGKLERFDSSAQKAYEAGDYKKAQSQWERLRLELSKSSENKSSADGDSDNAANKELQSCNQSTLRRLAECALQLKSFSTASDLLNQSKAALPAGAADSELEKDLIQLGTSYRLIEPASFGNEVASAFKEVGAEKISIAKTESGHHIEIILTDKITKPISQRGVSEVGFDKTISFDLSQRDDEIRIDRITGLKVHAQFWVNVIASRLRKNEAQEPVAEVTGEKMGISQSVSSRLPDQIYQPVMALISRVQNVFVDAVPGSDIANSNSVFSNGVNNGSNQGAIIPASNSGASATSTNTSTSTNTGTVIPLINDQPMENNVNEIEK